MKNRFLSICVVLFLVMPAVGQDDFSTDKKLGAQAAEQVEQMMGTYNDSILNDYVSQVGNRMVKTLGTVPFEFRFHVVDMPEPNAFALPGGYVYVSRGILSLINDEDELAGVMGHEMVHVTKRHSMKQMRKGIWPALLSIPGALVGLVSPDLGRIINVPVNFGTALFMSSYSRKQEREADELGIKLAAESGYNPSKLSGVLEHLAEEMEIQTGEEEEKSYFSSHPYTPRRVDDINEKAPQLTWNARPSIANQEMLYMKLDGMTLGPNPAQGVFDGPVFRHPDMEFVLTFPDDWKTINVPIALLATQPDGNAQIFLGGGDGSKSPQKQGAEMETLLVDKFNIKPYRNEAIEINGYSGHVVSFKDVSGKQPVDIQMYWIQTEHVQLNVLGMGYLDYSGVISAAATSLRPITDEEQKNIKATRLRLAEARQDESLQAFNERTGNDWDVKTTALMNALDPDKKLSSGQVLKVAKVEPYK